MILIAGELLIDMITTELVSGLDEAKEMVVKIGGSAGNFARFLKMQGCEIQLVAAVGEDGLGKMILKHLEDNNISTQHIKTCEDNFTSLIIVSKSQSTPEFIPHRDADKQIDKLDRELIENCSVFHTSAFSLSAEPARTNLISAMGVARDMGKKISLDWNFSTRIWGHHHTAKDIFDSAIQQNTLLKISMDDVSRFWDIEHDIIAAKKILELYNCEFICLSDGADGVHYMLADKVWYFKPALKANVVDTTGAGDAFWSGFISHYNSSNNIHEAVDHALVIARDKVEGKF